MSACGLFHIAYPSAPELLRSELRSVYNQLCHDDMPMVRRSAALNLGKFAATVEPMYLKSDIMTFFRDLTQDGECAISREILNFRNLNLSSVHSAFYSWARMKQRGMLDGLIENRPTYTH